MINQTKTFLGILLVLTISNAGAEAWEPVTGADKLSALFSGTVMTATLKADVTAIATYNSDGSGELNYYVERPDAFGSGMDDRIQCRAGC